MRYDRNSYTRALLQEVCGVDSILRAWHSGSLKKGLDI